MKGFQFNSPCLFEAPSCATARDQKLLVNGDLFLAQENVSSSPRATTTTQIDICQRMPWGGGKRRGVENLTNHPPRKKGFWTPPHTVRFPPPSGFSALFFLCKNPRQSRPEALLEGSKNIRESAFSGTFSSPHTFCTPPYHGPNLMQHLHGAYVVALLSASRKGTLDVTSRVPSDEGRSCRRRPFEGS